MKYYFEIDEQEKERLSEESPAYWKPNYIVEEFELDKGEQNEKQESKMKNYFQTNNVIIPYLSVLSIELYNEKDRQYYEHYVVSTSLKRYELDDSGQLFDYIQWLDLQHKKDLELAGLNKPIIPIENVIEQINKSLEEK